MFKQSKMLAGRAITGLTMKTFDHEWPITICWFDSCRPPWTTSVCDSFSLDTPNKLTYMYANKCYLLCCGHILTILYFMTVLGYPGWLLSGLQYLSTVVGHWPKCNNFKKLIIFSLLSLIYIIQPSEQMHNMLNLGYWLLATDKNLQSACDLHKVEMMRICLTTATTIF